MANIIKIKRGLEAARLGTTPLAGEPIFTTDTKELYIGDGTTAGGIKILNNLFDDTAPKLGGALNMNNFVLQDGYGNTAFFANGDLSTGGGYMQMGASPGVRLSLYPSSLGGQAIFQGNIGTLANKYLEINPTINDVGTNGWTGISMNVTETGVRTGTKTLIDLKVGGTSKFSVGSTGNTIIGGTIVSSGDISSTSGAFKLGAGGVLALAQSGNNFTIYNNIPGGKILFNKAAVSVASIEATSFIKTSGTSSQFLKADGSVDATTYQDASQKGMANGYASLDGAGTIPNAQLPALAITKTFTVSTELAQLALTAQEGDVAIRTDLNKTYIHNGGSAGTMADWSLLATPTDSVLSVFGRTGAVSATAGDYTAAQVTNAAAGNIAAITVQAAINELDTEKLALAGGTLTGALILSGAPTVNLHAATKLYVDTHTIDGGTF